MIPLVILVGINHHHQMVVFGCKLLMDKSISTYTRANHHQQMVVFGCTLLWTRVLVPIHKGWTCFLIQWMNKKPLSIATNEDIVVHKTV